MQESVYDVNPQPGNSWFRQYGKHFQEKIFQALINDPRYASQMIEVMHPEFFDLKYLQYLSEKYFSYRIKYKNFPTMKLLISIVRDDLHDESSAVLRDQVVGLPLPEECKVMYLLISLQSRSRSDLRASSVTIFAEIPLLS